ncbi:MAG TPA: class I SAM-dependent methyltransferase [Candidatus Acidoferrum sp.]
MELYKGSALLGENSDFYSGAEDTLPRWKMVEHAALLDGIERAGTTTGILLDVGCFSGLFLYNAKQRGFEVVGVEPNREAFVHVRDVRGYEVVHGSVQSAQFPAETFSAVSFLDVIEHVQNPVTELEEALRILKPGGALVLTTPNVKGLLQRVVKLKRTITKVPWCPIDDVPWHLWGFTRKSLMMCVEKAGFIVKEVAWLEPSPLSTNLDAGSSPVKKAGLRAVATISKRVGMSDRMALFAQKPGGQ